MMVIACDQDPTIHGVYVSTLVLLVFISLRRGDLIRRCCPSVGWSVLDFVIFQKRGFESINSKLSNTTKLTLLDTLLQEVTAIVRLPNPKLSTMV